MCWIGKDILLIAEDDIPVLKIGVQKKANKKIYSYFQFMEYKIGITYRSDIVKYNGLYYPDCITILEGLHSYNMDVNLVKFDCSYITICTKSVNKLIERYCINNTNEYDLVVMNCIIPKGATYYKNEDGEIVSNLIKFVKINSEY